MNIRRRLTDFAKDALGVHIISRSHTSWPEDNFTGRLFEDLAIDCIFDVGANVGQYALHVRKLGYKGIILSFEPGPAAFCELERAARGDEQWHVFNFALGSQKGEMPFNIMRSTAMSSFLRPSTEEGDMFSDVNVVESIIQVPVHVLAEVLPELQRQFDFQSPFLKLDTQGFDLQVIAGAGGALQRFCAILSEVAVKNLYAGAPIIDDSLNAFRSAGFDLIGLYPVHPGNLRNPYEFNCYTLRRDLASRP